MLRHFRGLSQAMRGFICDISADLAQQRGDEERGQCSHLQLVQAVKPRYAKRQGRTGPAPARLTVVRSN